VFTNRFGKKKYEDILQFQNTKTMMSTAEYTIKSKRDSQREARRKKI
jgi:hypothetical protein